MEIKMFYSSYCKSKVHDLNKNHAIRQMNKYQKNLITHIYAKRNKFISIKFVIY